MFSIQIQTHNLLLLLTLALASSYALSPTQNSSPNTTNISVFKYISNTRQMFGAAIDAVSNINQTPMNPLDLSAYHDCIHLLNLSLEHLQKSIHSSTPPTHKMMLLTAVQNNLRTCKEGLDMTRITPNVRSQIITKCFVKDLWDQASLSLKLIKSYQNGYESMPAQNTKAPASEAAPTDKCESMGSSSLGFSYPEWVNSEDIETLGSSEMAVDVTVSRTGAPGNNKTGVVVNTIKEAIERVPSMSPGRFLIFIEAGEYEENDLMLASDKWNVSLIGEGMYETRIRCRKNVMDSNVTTYGSACFAVFGSGTVISDIGFVNDAGPLKHQAVALIVNADQTTVYRCSIEGYQDTLYAHSLRQFYLNCHIYGTIDFIFGNAAVVFQSCQIFARLPIAYQSIVITAQGRSDHNQITGTSIQGCCILADSSLEPVKAHFTAFLGRPWGEYANTVFMQSFLGDLINSSGWMMWTNDTALQGKSFLGEYNNVGPGSNTVGRVKWSVNKMSSNQAEAFTVDSFIQGSEWLPRDLTFQGGL